MLGSRIITKRRNFHCNCVPDERPIGASGAERLWLLVCQFHLEVGVAVEVRLLLAVEPSRHAQRCLVVAVDEQRCDGVVRVLGEMGEEEARCGRRVAEDA